MVTARYNLALMLGKMALTLCLTRKSSSLSTLTGLAVSSSIEKMVIFMFPIAVREKHLLGVGSILRSMAAATSLTRWQSRLVTTR